MGKPGRGALPLCLPASGFGRGEEEGGQPTPSTRRLQKQLPLAAQKDESTETCDWLVGMGVLAQAKKHTYAYVSLAVALTQVLLQALRRMLVREHHISLPVAAQRC